MNPSMYVTYGIASVKKSFHLKRRYAFNTVMQIVAIYLLFALLFFGGRSIAPTQVSNSLGGIVVGYFVWTMATTAYTGVASNIRQEADWGTLEQLCLSPLGIGRVLLVDVLIKSVGTIVFGLIVLLMMIATTGRSLALDVVTVVPIAALTIVPAISLGLVLGGLALLYKRVGNVTTLFQFGFIAILAGPSDYPLWEALPLTIGTSLLERGIVEGVRLWNLPPGMVATLVLKAVGYILVGYLLFSVLQSRARHRGVLGHY